MYKKPKTVVQLTSLLDLLFVMIFISLIQQKTMVSPSEEIDQIEEQHVSLPVEDKQEITQSPSIAQESLVPNKPSRQTVNAIFKFYAVDSNPAVPHGSFLMQGIYDPNDNSLILGGLSWIDRPQGYEMVPLSGKIYPDEGIFEGSITFAGCQGFTLWRFNHDGPKTSIAGTWRGQYRCGQGATGLSLEIN